MKLTEEIIKILSCLEFGSHFEFVEIDENSILLNGKINLLDKIYSPSADGENYILSYQDFFRKIAGSITRLDHIGINYSCPSVEEEITFYKNIIKDSPLELVEEENPESDSRWFFIKSKIDDNAPLFEIVLVEKEEDVINKWKPHFQIDISTSLKIEDLREITNKYLAPDFIKWEMDVPGTGVVLAMGVIGQFGKTKIYIGLGTNKRNTDNRNEYLKKI